MRLLFFITAVGCTLGEASAPPADPVISGTISLRPELTRSVSMTDQIVIVAKREPGQPPLVVKKVAVGEFPLPFELQVPEGGEVELMVRVDKDGDAHTRKAGDLIGRASSVRVGSKRVDVLVSDVIP